MNILDGLMGGTLVGVILLFLQFLITRSDQKKEKNNAILQKIEDLADKLTRVEKKIDESEADRARQRILIFDDELRRGMDHSEELFDQILASINNYEKYCVLHPDYKNSKAVNSIEHIEHVYQQVKMENRFI